MDDWMGLLRLRCPFRQPSFTPLLPAVLPHTNTPLPWAPAAAASCSLVTHAPHFNLLREVVSYSGGGRGQPAREVLDNPCQEHFVLLQIGCAGVGGRVGARASDDLL